MNKRVVLSFDAIAYGNLEELRKKGGFKTVADAVRDSLVVRAVLRNQSDRGFTEVVLRNPKTKKERTIDIDANSKG
jgi:hypothetical protein